VPSKQCARIVKGMDTTMVFIRNYMIIKAKLVCPAPGEDVPALLFSVRNLTD
jgi:hypothetical protein